MKQKIAIDIGYGDTKVCSSSGYKKFPTAVRKQAESQADFSNSAPGTYKYDGVYYNVGNGAVMDAITTRGFDFLVKYAPLIAYHAFGEDIQGSHLITGLSIVNWNDRQRYLDALSTINVDRKTVVPAKITLLAQGQGVINLYDGDKKGIICVVDIGYNTFDFLAFENGRPRPDFSFATKQGTNKIITDLQSLIQKRYNFELSEQNAKEVFESRTLQLYGDKMDLTDHINTELDFYTDFIINEIKSKRLDLVKRADKVIFAGGGAYYLQGHSLPKNTMFTEMPYEFSNVRGYWRV